jgi:MerR family transcriptional regulator, light-induced transcriptional regulator
MGCYSIKDLERISGIKAHTLRIWEQRYNILTPERTDTNIRTYSDEDLKRVLNISILNNHGLKISKIANLSAESIQEKVKELSQVKDDAGTQIDNLIIAMVELDEERFERFVSANILRLGFEKTMTQIIYPFMQKVGVLWITNSINPAQEHFISNLIRQKLIVATDALNVNTTYTDCKVMCYLPEHELHEIGLLFANYLLKTRGLKTVYLGQSVPYNDLKMVYEVHQPKFIMTVLTASFPKDESMEEYLNHLSIDFPQSTILITGWQTTEYQSKTPANVILIKDVNHLLEFMDAQKAAATAS